MSTYARNKQTRDNNAGSQMDNWTCSGRSLTAPGPAAHQRCGRGRLTPLNEFGFVSRIMQLGPFRLGGVKLNYSFCSVLLTNAVRARHERKIAGLRSLFITYRLLAVLYFQKYNSSKSRLIVTQTEMDCVIKRFAPSTRSVRHSRSRLEL